MAENRNITWEIIYRFEGEMTHPATLHLESDALERGKWIQVPPIEIKTSPGNSTHVLFKACGTACSATGVSGAVVYKADDPEGTRFRLSFDIPYSSANSGRVNGGSSSFRVEGGLVPASGNSVTVPVKIIQVDPFKTI
jgi:hypothetical protein